MRVFYVVYPENKSLQTCIDAIRLIANPREKSRAHITVRGPYKQRYKLTHLNKIIAGTTVEVLGIGRFWNSSQNTIYLRCESKVLGKVWKKKDYKEFNPHISIYDGDSREFATKFLEILHDHNFQFSFVSSSLMPLVSANGQRNYLSDILFSLDWNFVSTILNTSLDRYVVETMQDQTRFVLIRLLCEYLTSVWVAPCAETQQSSPKILETLYT